MFIDWEYFVEGVQSFFDCNDEQILINGIYNYVNIRIELVSYDLVFYGFFLEIFFCWNKYVK